NLGGGGRDRTDDLKLAKLPLSQLSYAPSKISILIERPACKATKREWWAEEDLNLRPHAYQARALTS
ncbi:unnamed protein product, partial [Ectocarpus sp. 12 AP-2014]